MILHFGRNQFISYYYHVSYTNHSYSIYQPIIHDCHLSNIISLHFDLEFSVWFREMQWSIDYEIETTVIMIKSTRINNVSYSIIMKQHWYQCKHRNRMANITFHFITLWIWNIPSNSHNLENMIIPITSTTTTTTQFLTINSNINELYTIYTSLIQHRFICDNRIWIV